MWHPLLSPSHPRLETASNSDNDRTSIITPIHIRTYICPYTDSDFVRRNVTPVFTSAKLSPSKDQSHGPSASSSSLARSSSFETRLLVDSSLIANDELPHRDSHDSFTHHPSLPDREDRQRSPPPQYPASEPADSTPTSLVSYRTAPPPPFSSLFASPLSLDQPGPAATSAAAVVLLDNQDLFASDLAPPDKPSAPAYEPPAASGSAEASTVYRDTVAETKRALPQDTKADGSSRPKDDDTEPPPAYSEDASSPLPSFAYIMAAAGGASSIITQVQQGAPPINPIGDVGADETISMDLRCVDSKSTHTYTPTNTNPPQF